MLVSSSCQVSLPAHSSSLRAHTSICKAFPSLNKNLSLTPYPCPSPLYGTNLGKNYLYYFNLLSSPFPWNLPQVCFLWHHSRKCRSTHQQPCQGRHTPNVSSHVKRAPLLETSCSCQPLTDPRERSDNCEFGKHGQPGHVLPFKKTHLPPENSLFFLYPLAPRRRPTTAALVSPLEADKKCGISGHTPDCSARIHVQCDRR